MAGGMNVSKARRVIKCNANRQAGRSARTWPRHMLLQSNPNRIDTNKHRQSGTKSRAADPGDGGSSANYRRLIAKASQYLQFFLMRYRSPRRGGSESARSFVSERKGKAARAGHHRHSIRCIEQEREDRQQWQRPQRAINACVAAALLDSLQVHSVAGDQRRRWDFVL